MKNLSAHILRFEEKTHQGLNFDLVQTALAHGQIPVNKVKDKDVSAFLKLLNHHGINNLVVVGGAVRDVFWGKAVNDIDIGVKVQMTDEERHLAAHIGTQASKQMYARASSALNQLAKVLKIPVERFFDKDNPPYFNGIKLHYLGPHLIPPKENQREVIPQGIIADVQSGNVYSSYTAPSLLQMALHSDGRLYGYLKPLQDLLNGRVQLQGDLQNGRNLSLLAIIKWLRLKHEFGLSLDSEDYLLVIKVLEQPNRLYRKPSANAATAGPFTRFPIKSNNKIITNYDASLVHQAMQGLIDGAVNPQAALIDLQQLGLLRMTGFTYPKVNVNFVSTLRQRIKTGLKNIIALPTAFLISNNYLLSYIILQSNSHN